jgi:peptidyl-prolyl cis-trans isomerase A (cyclophilin A)
MRTVAAVSLFALALSVAGVASAQKKADPKKAEPKKEAPAKVAGNPVVQFKTTLGAFKIELDQQNAPVSTKNFLEYVEAKHYDGILFHRVISSFMVQGGGYDKEMNQRPVRAPIANESKNGLKNVRGSVAMARTSEPGSATSQFFINVVDNARLDYPSFDGHGYAVFGKVVEGMETVDRIRDTKTGVAKNGMSDVPVTPVVVESARRVK